MNALVTIQALPPGVTIPPRKGSGGRSDVVHAAIWYAYMHCDLGGEGAAAAVNRDHGTVETRCSIIAYANRQGWLKGRRAAVPKAAEKVRKIREGVRLVEAFTGAAAPARKLERAPSLPRKVLPVTPDDADDVELGERGASPSGYRLRVHAPNPLSAALRDLDAPDDNGKVLPSCHFPVGPDCPGHMADHLMCGRERHPDHRYCPKHNKVAFGSRHAA